MSDFYTTLGYTVSVNVKLDITLEYEDNLADRVTVWIPTAARLFVTTVINPD